MLVCFHLQLLMHTIGSHLKHVALFYCCKALRVTDDVPSSGIQSCVHAIMENFRSQPGETPRNSAVHSHNTARERLLTGRSTSTPPFVCNACVFVLRPLSTGLESSCYLFSSRLLSETHQKSNCPYYLGTYVTIGNKLCTRRRNEGE